MQKIVVNKTFGGFQLTDEMMDYIGYKKTSEYDKCWDASRTDPKLIEFLETTPPEKHGTLGICYVPDDVDWEIEEYDGREWVSEIHRCWFPE